MIFELLRQKWRRIIYKFRQNPISGPETCQIGPKLWLRSCPDLSRRTSTYCKPAEILLFFQILHLSIFISKFNTAYKIMCFSKINLSFLWNHVLWITSKHSHVEASLSNLNALHCWLGWRKQLWHKSWQNRYGHPVAGELSWFWVT